MATKALAGFAAQYAHDAVHGHHAQINWLFSGTIVVEFFFTYKGFGALLLEACLNQDIYLIEACTMVAVCVAMLTQTLADVGYAYLYPRLRGAA